MFNHHVGHRHQVQVQLQQSQITMVLSWQTKTDRFMSRIAVIILSMGAIYMVFTFGRPIWWRLYASVLRPFEDGSSGG